jgi:hypothetical protein
MENLIHKIVTPRFIGRTKYAKLVLIIVLVLAVSFIGIVYFSEKPSVNIGNEFLTIKSLFYGKNIPIGEINITGIKQLNLNNDKDYNIKVKCHRQSRWLEFMNRSKRCV